MRFKLFAAVVSALCLSALSCAPSSAGAVTVGISDNNTAMFTNTWFTALHVRQARLVVEWNVATVKNHSLLNATRTWISDAQAAGVSPLIDFQADAGSAGNHIPTVKEYTQAVTAFIKDFPTVKQYIPWNEPDWNYRKLSQEPTLAAAYFNTLVQVCKGCTVVAGDLYLDAKHLGAWIKSYGKGLRYRPAAWALHPYDDVQGHTSAQIQVMMKLVKGPIWLTEISGVVRRGHWHGHTLTQSLTKQATDEQYLFSLTKKFPRIARIYHYQWQGDPNVPWDSGLLNPDGTPRPAYYVLAKAAS